MQQVATAYSPCQSDDPQSGPVRPPMTRRAERLAALLRHGECFDFATARSRNRLRWRAAPISPVGRSTYLGDTVGRMWG